MTKTKPKTKAGIRRTFTLEYKLQAVQLVTEKGFSYAEAARQLGLCDTQIRTWKKQFDAGGYEGRFPAGATGTRSRRKSTGCGPRTNACCRSAAS